jgi:hypothetical protein
MGIVGPGIKDVDMMFVQHLLQLCHVKDSL